MRSGTRALILTGAAFAATATGCGSRAETAGESPVVAANNGTTMDTVTAPETTLQTTTTRPKSTTTQSTLPKISTTVTTEARVDNPDSLVTRDGIGDLHIGQNKQEVEAAGYYLTPGCGENNYTADNPQTSVGVDFVGGLVEQIWVYEFGPETAEGVGIGTTREEAMQKLGKAGLGPTTSVFDGLYGDVDFINVDTEGATLHFEIQGLDGAMRVNSMVVTRQGEDPAYTCE